MRRFALIAGGVMAILPQVCHAVGINPCPVPGIPCGDLPSVIDTTIAQPALAAFGGFLVAMFVFYGIRLLLTTGDDNAQTKIRYAFQYSIFGIVLVTSAYLITSSIVDNSGIVDASAISTGILVPLKQAIVGLVGTALIVTITFQGIRLILSEDESQASAARKRFIAGPLGAVVIAVEDQIIDAIATPHGGSSILAEEIAGIARFLATIFGALAVIALIVGGIMLVVSVQDSLKDRAKKIITASIVAIIVVLMAYGLVTALIT
jgi:hypothetical protein